MCERKSSEQLKMLQIIGDSRCQFWNQKIKLLSSDYNV